MDAGLKPKCNLTLEAKNLPQMFITEPLKAVKSYNFFKNPAGSHLERANAAHQSDRRLKDKMKQSHFPEDLKFGHQHQRMALSDLSDPEKENNMLLSNLIDQEMANHQDHALQSRKHNQTKPRQGAHLD